MKKIILLILVFITISVACEAKERNELMPLAYSLQQANELLRSGEYEDAFQMVRTALGALRNKETVLENYLDLTMEDIERSYAGVPKFLQLKYVFENTAIQNSEIPSRIDLVTYYLLAENLSKIKLKVLQEKQREDYRNKDQIDNFDKAQNSLLKISLAILKFESELGRYPSDEKGLYDLIEDPGAETSWNGPYLDPHLLIDPWGFPYQYNIVGASYEVKSLGIDKQDPGDDIQL